MNINETLSLIKDKCENFSNLPESMRENINKKEMRNYLINILKLEEKVTNNFLDLIYDDNEEDKDNVTTQHFIEKYTSLLKILETTESEDEEKNIINNNEEKEKELKEIDIGSLIKENNKGENLFDEELTKDLIKELNFNEYNNNNYFENPNFYSIIRPSNDFQFNLNNNKIEEDLIKKESNIKKLNKQEEQKILNINNLKSLKYDLRKMISSNNNILYNMINNQKHLSIKQKLQDVFFQIHKPNDIKRFNVYPDNSKKFNFTYNPNKNYKTYISSPIKNDNYLNYFQNKLNAYKNYSPEKNNYDKLYVTSNYKKNNINKKLEGLNKILFSKNLDNINNNILNPDDFLSLEEKIKQFEKKKIEIKRKHNQILNDINSGSIIFNERENE